MRPQGNRERLQLSIGRSLEELEKDRLLVKNKERKTTREKKRKTARD